MEVFSILVGLDLMISVSSVTFLARCHFLGWIHCLS